MIKENHTSHDAGRAIKVAIIGSGLAGLHAAHLLSKTANLRKQFDVHLFEANKRLGLGGSSIIINDMLIDVPLRSFNAGYYPSLVKLYKELGISIRKANFAFSFATFANFDFPFFLYNGHSGVRGFSIPWQPSICTSVFYMISRLQLFIIFISSYFCLLGFAMYHSILGHLQDPFHSISSEPLSTWLSRHTTFINPIFVEFLLIPLFSAMTTSSTDQVYQLPTAEVLLYIASTLLRNHYTVTQGVCQVQSRLISSLPRQNIHQATSIDRVSISEDNATTISLYSLSTSKRYDGFHHIIFAAPANLSASLLQSYRKSLSSFCKDDIVRNEISRTRKLQEQLEKVKYVSSTVIIHTDISLLPHNKQDWRDLNLIRPTSNTREEEEEEEEEERSRQKRKVARDCTMTTHVCHDSKDGSFIFQTTNPLILPSTRSTLSSSTFQRALTVGKGEIQGLFIWEKKKSNMIDHLIGGRWELELGPLHQRIEHNLPQVWFCGSYAQGIPLLEGCVTSSRLVVAAIQQQHNKLGL